MGCFVKGSSGCEILLSGVNVCRRIELWVGVNYMSTFGRKFLEGFNHFCLKIKENRRSHTNGSPKQGMGCGRRWYILVLHGKGTVSWRPKVS